jgi:hypothetical protein
MKKLILLSLILILTGVGCTKDEENPIIIRARCLVDKNSQIADCSYLSTEETSTTTPQENIMPEKEIDWTKISDEDLIEIIISLPVGTEELDKAIEEQNKRKEQKAQEILDKYR